MMKYKQFQLAIYDIFSKVCLEKMIEYIKGEREDRQLQIITPDRRKPDL